MNRLFLLYIFDETIYVLDKETAEVVLEIMIRDITKDGIKSDVDKFNRFISRVVRDIAKKKYKKPR